MFLAKIAVRNVLLSWLAYLCPSVMNIWWQRQYFRRCVMLYLSLLTASRVHQMSISDDWSNMFESLSLSFPFPTSCLPDIILFTSGKISITVKGGDYYISKDKLTSYLYLRNVDVFRFVFIHGDTSKRNNDGRNNWDI